MPNACNVILIGRVVHAAKLTRTEAGITRADLVLTYNPFAFDPETGKVEKMQVFIEAVASDFPGGRRLADVVSKMAVGETHYFQGRILSGRRTDPETGFRYEKPYLTIELIEFIDDNRPPRS